MLWLAVSGAAGVGAVLRYVVDRALIRRYRLGWPLGTFVVNMLGSLLLGLMVGLSTHHGLGAVALDVVGAGFAGGFTTLSTWAWESIELAETGDVMAAVLNVAGSIAVGLLAAAAGLGLAS